MKRIREETEIPDFSLEEKEEKFVEIPTDVRQSGFCDKCRNYYDSAPVVDGIVICPNCAKNK